MKKVNQNRSEAKPIKAFVVKYGIATVGDGGERDNFHLGLVEASDLQAARELAMEDHCWEGFEGEDNGDNDHGRWIEYNGYRAFQVRETACDIDANSIYWIDAIIEVPDEDVPVLRKYLK